MSKIEWTNETWNPVRGCSRVSPGCDNCYAMRMARRQDHLGGAYEGLTRIGKRGVDWSGVARFVPEALAQPLRWRKPRRVFVNSMSDLFHPSLTNEQIAAVFGVMAACPRHTFQVLTKRAERMREWFEWAERLGAASTPIRIALGAREFIDEARINGCHGDEIAPWPLPNVWIGVSTEDQRRADERIPHLLATPAAVRFVSAEPLLGPIDFGSIPANLPTLPGGEVGDWFDALNGTSEGPDGSTSSADYPTLDWVIPGGESGNGARQCDVEWVRSIVRQCRNAGVACFVKQLGAVYVDAVNGIGGAKARPDPDLVPQIQRLKHGKGGDPAEWPQDLRVREFPA